MKSFYLCIILSVLIASCVQPIAEEDQPSRKQVTTFRYQVKNANPDNITLGSFVIDEYDQDDLIHTSSYHNPDSSIMMTFKNDYDNNRIKSRINWVNGAGEQVRYVDVEYNDDEKKIRSAQYSMQDSLLSEMRSNWKENNTLQETGLVENGEFIPNAFYKYNEWDEYKELKEYEEDSLIAVYNWDYKSMNQHNHWTERHVIINDTLVSIERKEIKYYK